MNGPRTTLYRDKQNSRFFGVCAGIADYTGFNLAFIRLLTLISTVVSGGATIPFYIVAGFLLKKKPVNLYLDQKEQLYWQGVRKDPKRIAREIRARFRDVNRRLGEVEHFYVSSNAPLSNEIERLRDDRPEGRLR